MNPTSRPARLPAPPPEVARVLESISDGFFTLDGDWNFTYVNQRALDFLGRTQEQVLGRNVWDEFPMESGRSFKPNYERAMLAREAVEFEEYAPSLERWYEVRAYPSDDGGISVFFRDVSERKQLQLKLQESERRFHATFNQAAVGIANVGLDGRWLDVNEKLCQILGYTREELLSTTFQAITYPDDLNIDLSLYERLQAGEVNFYAMEKRYVRKDGSLVWVNLTVALIRDNNGVPVQGVSVIEDISESKRAEEALHESEERARMAAKAADLGIFDWNLTTGQLICSARLKEIFGYKPHETVTHDMLVKALHPEERGRRDLLFNAAVERRSDYDVEYRVVWPDESVHWISTRGRAYYDDAGRPIRFSGVSADITARKEMERALIRSEKLASVGRMAATIAHEINNPLAAVMNLLYLASADSAVSEAGLRYLNTAQQELQRAAHITKQTLGFYREAGTPQQVNVPDLIEGVLDLFAPRLTNRSITVERRLDKNATAYVIAGELRQVVSNLISNAIDALPERGGRIFVRARKVMCVNDTVLTQISVADNGTGISGDTKKKIFDAFFTTKEAVGTGLGLWVSRDIIERSGGRIRVRSKRDHGSVFAVWLPATEQRWSMSEASGS